MRRKPGLRKRGPQHRHIFRNLADQTRGDARRDRALRQKQIHPVGDTSESIHND
jgi:hypothetical protein